MFPGVTEQEMSEARADAQALMQDTCQITRVTGYAAQDEISMREVPVTVPVLTSMCRLQVQGTAASGSLQLSEVESGAHVETVARVILVLPYDTVGVRVNDLATITALGPGTMPTELGRQLRVVGFSPKTHATALRVQVEDVL